MLRYGGFYGPGTGIADDGDQAQMVRKRKFPLVGSGDGVFSFIHTADVASATLAAIEHGKPGEIYNVVDDEPAPVREWLPYLARHARRQAAAARPGVARPAHREPRGGGNDDRGARRVERQGEGRTALDAALRELARGLRQARVREPRKPLEN